MARMNNVDLIKLGAEFSERAYGKRTDLLPSGWVELLSIDKASGYQAKVYVNHTTHEIFYANTGTNDGLFGQDAQGWSDAVFGPRSPQFQDMLLESSLINDEVKNGGIRNIQGYTVYTTGHSWGELMGQAQTYTFGWTGVGYDGPGAGLVVSDSRFSTMLQAQNITAVGGTDFITVDTTGLGPMGGAFIGDIGANISGTAQFNVTLPSSSQSGAFNIFTAAAGGVVAGLPGIVLGGVGGKVYTGVVLHDMSGINQAIQDGNFEPAGANGGWWLTESSSGVVFSNNNYRYDNPEAGVYVEWNATGAEWTYPDGNGGTIKVLQFADDTAVWTRQDGLGSIIEQLIVDPVTGTVTHQPPTGTRVYWHQISELGTGNIIGEMAEAAAPSAPTPDPLSSFINLIRTDLSLEEQALLNASEIGALTGTQGLSDSWGGVNLLEFSGGTLGDYWNNTRDSDFTGDYYDYFDNPVDYSLTGAGHYASLGFMPAFSLASNSGSFLSTGYTARGFDSYTSFLPTSWQFDAIAWNNINTAPLSTTPSLFDALGGNNLITSVNDGFGNISYEWRIAGSGDSSTVFYYGSGSYGDNIFLPLALDLDGDGVELVSKEDSRAYYDVKGDGFRHNVGWIGADDAFLAIDKNSDGKIELADELSFALWTPDPSDTDLQALKTVFDTNGDDVFNRGDAQFSQFRVWQDANGDGITDAGELKTLAERGIASINLTAAKTDWASGGNHITGFSTFQKADGSNGWAADVGLGHEADGWRATVESSLVRVTQSGGLVYGLANGGASLTADLASQGLDGAVGGNGTDTLTAGHSTGALLVGGDGNDVLNGGARDDWLSGGAGSDILNGGAGGDTLLIDAADMQANINGGDGFDIAVVTGTAGVTLDMFHTKLEAAIGGDGDDRFYTTGTARAVLAGQGGNDLLKSGAGHDVLQGGTGNDTLYGGYGTDTAIYTGNQGDYTFAANADGSLTVRDVNVANGDDGTDTLYGIQTLRFADGDMYVTPSNTGKGETRVNTTTVRDQFFPSVAALADGGYVVTWMDDLAVATDANIYAQRYGVDGNAVGSEFVVNTYAANHQEIPSVTGLADGGFVIVWRSTDQDDSGRGIYGQRYAADGTRAGSEFRVNTYTADHQDDPTIIALNDGGFLVTWQSNLQDGSGYGIYAQRFDTSGVKAGGEFRVNTTASSGQFNAEAVMLTDGGFVMTWSSGAAPNTANIYAQRYDANGIKIGGETKVNTTVYGAEATVTALADGGYVVAWLAIVSGSQWHVFGQRYIADGAAVGGELMLSTSSTGASTTTYNSLQVAPVVTALADGSYVAVWTVYGTTGADIYFRRAMDGNAIGDVVRVNTTTAENQSTPAVTAMPDGGFVVSWTGRDASLNEDVFVQRYDADGKPWTAEQTIAGSAGNDHLNSATGAIVLTLQGLAGNDVLTGGAGNETLDGGAGEDVMSGGAGNDTYVVDTLADVVNENANEGTDTVQTALTYTLGADVENLTLTGATATNGTGNALNNVLTGNSAANVLTGGLGDDTYVVSTGDTVVENASEGIDTVQSNITYTLGANVENLSLTGTTAINGTGNALNNVLTGNSAANILTGGLGDDLYVISTGDTVSEVAGQGTDTVQSPITYTLAANVENLALTGTAAINGTGNTLNNVITGNSAKNVLDGSTGTDTMAGGAGDDTYVVDNVGDVVTENSGEGTDTVQTALTYTLGADVENLTLTGATAINGTGNAQNNTLTGNSAANVLSGGLGDDTYVVSTGDTVVENANEGIDTVQSNITYTLGANVENLTLTGATAINGTGNALNNVLTGNSAANILTGGLGDDTYVVSTGDTVVENASEGIDTVQSNITYTLGANVETLMLTGTTAINGTGNTFNNVLLGNSAANTLDGGVGADTMLGGLGDDIYIVDNSADLALENASEGTDTVQSSVTYSLVSAVENLTLTGVAAINGTGNVLNNTLTGNSAANVLSGGLGDDTYVVSTGDTVVENANEGIDTVQSNITYTLGANVENLTLTGATAINGTGNVLNNTLTGNSAANILTGGLGDDAYVVSTGDTVVENASEGIDTVQSNITYTLGANVENLTLAGTAAINGTGNAADNLLTGNSVANTLDGGLGNDTIVGGTGNDNVLGGAGDDLYLFNRGDGVDTLTDTSGVDTLKFGPGITLDDIEIEAVGADLIVGLRQAGVATTALLDRI
jgi:serralysin